MGNLKGLVLSGKKGFYTVLSEETEYICRSAAKIAKFEGKLLAGDLVEFSDNGDGTGFINRLLPRKNSLVRPPVANADVLAVVLSPTEPEPFIYNVDLLTVLAVKAGIEPVIILTKCDIAPYAHIAEIYRKTPFRVIPTSSATGMGVDEAREALSGKICILCGASGVGKSTLLNAMYPHIGAETGELSKRIQRGKNTTRTTELFLLGNGTFVADTPGFSAIETEQYFSIEPKELFELFPDFAEFSQDCRYTDCTHTKEEECGIRYAAGDGRLAVSRHESYIRLYTELKNIDKYK